MCICGFQAWLPISADSNLKGRFDSSIAFPVGIPVGIYKSYSTNQWVFQWEARSFATNPTGRCCEPLVTSLRVNKLNVTPGSEHGGRWRLRQACCVTPLASMVHPHIIFRVPDCKISSLWDCWESHHRSIYIAAP